MAIAPQLPEFDFEAMSAEDLLRWGYEEYGDKLCLTCSWQKQSSVLVHMVSELSDDAKAAVVGALRGLEVPPARRLGRETRLGLHPGQRDSVQPAARVRLPLDRVHPLHPPDRTGRG